MATTDKIRKDIAKTKEKISQLQTKLRTLETQLTEEENLEIVRMVKAVKMDNRELTAFLRAYASGQIVLPEEMRAALEQEDDTDMEASEDEIYPKRSRRSVRSWTSSAVMLFPRICF